VSPKPKSPDDAEGWESLAQDEDSEGALAPNPELEEALREAAAAVDERERTAAEPSAEPVDLSNQLAETQDRLLRLQADFENFRRRALKEREEALQYGSHNLVKDLLSTVDNLDRAIDHVSRSEGGDFEGLLQGVDLVRRELLSALAKHGVTEIEAEGQPFDPALHEAMAQRPDEKVAENTVIEVLQKGYQLRDRLLRPAMVVVAAAPQAGDDGEGADG
jgi:molecular chaperone GrpE